MRPSVCLYCCLIAQHILDSAVGRVWIPLTAADVLTALLHGPAHVHSLRYMLQWYHPCLYFYAKASCWMVLRRSPHTPASTPLTCLVPHHHVCLLVLLAPSTEWEQKTPTRATSLSGSATHPTSQQQRHTSHELGRTRRPAAAAAAQRRQHAQHAQHTPCQQSHTPGAPHLGSCRHPYHRSPGATWLPAGVTGDAQG